MLSPQVGAVVAYASNLLSSPRSLRLSSTSKLSNVAHFSLDKQVSYLSGEGLLKLSRGRLLCV